MAFLHPVAAYMRVRSGRRRFFCCGTDNARGPLAAPALLLMKIPPFRSCSCALMMTLTSDDERGSATKRTSYYRPITNTTTTTDTTNNNVGPGLRRQRVPAGAGALCSSW